MVDRVVVSHADDGMPFIADEWAVMADAVNDTRLVTSGHTNLPHDGEAVRVAVMDHILDRLTEARTGLIALPHLDVVDRLHGELAQDHARV